jgi:hypothetical protein
MLQFKQIQANSEKPDTAAMGANANQKGNSDQEELKTALIAAQESAAVQILLEACLPRPEDQVWRTILSILHHVIFYLSF